MSELTNNNLTNKTFKTAIINMLERLKEITLKKAKDSMRRVSYQTRMNKFINKMKLLFSQQLWR